MHDGFLGTGLTFPPRLKGGARMAMSSGDAKVRESIWLILSTARGERVMRPDFGCGIHDLVFEPNTATLRQLTVAKVRESLFLWEPRIDVINVTATTAPERRNQLLIEISYRLRSSNTVNNMVYPFFLNEDVE